jgi:hypothetical protein
MKVQLLAGILAEGLGWVATAFLAPPLSETESTMHGHCNRPPVSMRLHLCIVFFSSDYGYRLAWQLNPERTCFECHGVVSSSRTITEHDDAVYFELVCCRSDVSARQSLSASAALEQLLEPPDHIPIRSRGRRKLPRQRTPPRRRFTAELERDTEEGLDRM